MEHKLSIVILAAGKGSRMKSSYAKVLHSVCGKEMLYHIIKESLKISDDVSVIVAHQKESVVEKISKYFPNINFLTQDLINYPGTGGALRELKAKYENVLILNGDMPLITAESLSGFLEQNSDITMSIFDLKNPSGYGRVAIKDGEVNYIVEEKDSNEDELKITTVNAGIYCFKRAVLEKYIPLLKNNNAQNEYYLTDVISMAKSDGCAIKPLLVDEEYFKGVNSKLDLARSEEIMLRRIKEKWMSEGVIMTLPDSIYIEDSVQFIGECIVENGVRITGKTIIENSHIKAHSVIEDSHIKNSDVGPLAHIRPACVIVDTHIGNFVEVKKSTLNGVKAGHLSYLGDSSIDEGTNIGAGVITCNYDGKNKYQTIIGKNVFVGSDTQIVAPCVIEDNVLIAAGTTVSANKIHSGVLAISRTPMKFVENFYFKFFGKK